MIAARHASAVRLAFVACAGGGVIDSISHLAEGGRPLSIAGIVTDRPCGAERIAARHAIDFRRIDQEPQATWSTRAAAVLRAWRPDVVVLLFLRRVGHEIWRDLGGVMRIWNLHPSLLPAYRGLKALERSWSDATAAAARGPSIPLGVTLHTVTGDLDAGPIIAQRSFDVRDTPTLEHARHLVHLLKLALLLEALAALRGDRLTTLDDVASLAQPWAAPLIARPAEAACT